VVSSTNKTDHHHITEILLKVALNTINLNQSYHASSLKQQSTGKYVTQLILTPSRSLCSPSLVCWGEAANANNIIFDTGTTVEFGKLLSTAIKLRQRFLDLESSPNSRL
jgi:hypothetical protein